MDKAINGTKQYTSREMCGATDQLIADIKGIANAMAVVHTVREYHFGQIMGKLVKNHDDDFTIHFGNYTATGAIYCLTYKPDGIKYYLTISAAPDKGV